MQIHPQNLPHVYAQFAIDVPGWSRMCLRASLTSLWQTVQSVCRLSREHCPPPLNTGLMWSTCQNCPSPGFLIISLSCNKNTRSALLNIHRRNSWFCIVQSCSYSKILGKNTLGWLFIAFLWIEESLQVNNLKAIKCVSEKVLLPLPKPFWKNYKQE